MTDDPLSEYEIEKRWPALLAVSGALIEAVGGPFTNTPAPHFQTDIAAAGGLAGLMILQESVSDLARTTDEVGPGNMIVAEVIPGQQLVHEFMTRVAHGSGIDPRGGWFDPVPEDQKPLLTCEEMTRRLAPSFYASCTLQDLPREYHKFAAAAAALRLARAAIQIKTLDPDTAKSIAFFNVVVGSKTLPHSEALWSD